MQAPRVHIVVLNWNNATDTIDCLRSLEQHACDNAETVVVDNGSTDGSAAEIALRFPDVRMLLLPENLGFSGGVNAGLQDAAEKKANYAFLLNNDAKVEANTIANLVECAEDNGKAGILGAKVMMADAPNTVESKGVSINLFTGRIRQIGFGKPDSEMAKEPVERQAVHGAAMLIRMKMFGDIGPLAEEYFCYFEEIDYCLRAAKAGWQVLYCPTARVAHKGAASFGGGLSAKRLYYAARNHPLLISKYSDRYFLPIRLLWVRLLTRLQLLRMPAKKRKRLKHWIKKAWSDFNDGKFGRADYDFDE